MTAVAGVGRIGAEEPSSGSVSGDTYARARLHLLARLLRWRWLLLSAWAGVSCWSAYWPSLDWGTFAWGGDVLFGSRHPLATGPHMFMRPGPGGLHTFASNHILQTGPITLVLAKGINWVGPGNGQAVATGIIELLGLGILLLLEGVARRLRGDDAAARLVWIPLTTLLGGFIFLQTWSDVSASWAHLDDGLALFLAALGIWALASKKPVVMGLALGLAAASKPWALGLAPLLLALKGADLRKGILALAGGAALPWLPFFVGDWGTVHASDFPIYLQPAAPLVALGVDPQLLRHSTEWRLLQLVADAAAVVAAVRWRAWGAALLACFAARLLTDPMSYSYYQASLAVGAIAFDLIVWRRNIPLATILAGFCWVVSTNFGRSSQALPLLCGYVLALGLVGLAMMRSRRQSEPQPT